MRSRMPSITAARCLGSIAWPFYRGLAADRVETPHCRKAGRSGWAPSAWSSRTITPAPWTGDPASAGSMAAVDWCHDLPAWMSTERPCAKRADRLAAVNEAYHVVCWSRATMPRCTSRNDLGKCPNRIAVNTVRDAAEAARSAEDPAASVSPHLCYQRRAMHDLRDLGQGANSPCAGAWARQKLEKILWTHSAAARLPCGRRIRWTMTSLVRK